MTDQTKFIFKPELQKEPVWCYDVFYSLTVSGCIDPRKMLLDQSQIEQVEKSHRTYQNLSIHQLEHISIMLLLTVWQETQSRRVIPENCMVVSAPKKKLSNG